MRKSALRLKDLLRKGVERGESVPEDQRGMEIGLQIDDLAFVAAVKTLNIVCKRMTEPEITDMLQNATYSLGVEAEEDGLSLGSLFRQSTG